MVTRLGRAVGRGRERSGRASLVARGRRRKSEGDQTRSSKEEAVCGRVVGRGLRLVTTKGARPWGL